MTVIVTTNASGRVRGFLASCMCEIGPGVYTAPRMDKRVRQRVWEVLEEWCLSVTSCTVLMTWPDRQRPGGQAVEVIGLPNAQLHDHYGVYLSRRELPEGSRAEKGPKEGQEPSEEPQF